MEDNVALAAAMKLSDCLVELALYIRAQVLHIYFVASVAILASMNHLY